MTGSCRHCCPSPRGRPFPPPPSQPSQTSHFIHNYDSPDTCGPVRTPSQKSLEERSFSWLPARLPYLLAALPGALSWVSRGAKFTYKCVYREPKTKQRKLRSEERPRVRSYAPRSGLHGEAGCSAVRAVEGRAWHVLCLLSSLGTSSRRMGALCACPDHCCAMKGQKNWTEKRSCTGIPMSGGERRTEYVRPAWAKNSRPTWVTW